MKIIIQLFIACFIPVFVWAQKNETAGAIFDRVQKEMADFRIDTSAVPEDRITRKIRQLRTLKGGFNINEAVAYKMQEERSKKETPAETLDFLAREFESGKGKKWLDNAVIRIFREMFTYKELKQLVRFYKTSAGQKLATDFPMLMMKSLMAGQYVHDLLVKEAPSL